jgi:Permuted papain-like amidase enzyme, YaeF/YiiX, C92 family
MPNDTSDPGVLLPAYDELRPDLDCGDVLLFGGDSRFCRAIKRLTGGRWSHTALVARARPDSPPLLWEATLSSTIPDVVTREIAGGVRLYDLEQWIRHYAGETAIRRLQVERTDAMRQALLDFYNEAAGRPYEKNRLEMLRAAHDGPLLRNREPTTDSFYCAELVAEAYQRMGLLPTKPPSNDYMPKDFSSECRRPLPLLLGATLDAEVLVCDPGK